MQPQINWTRITHSANGRYRAPTYCATYYDEQGHAIVHGQSATAGQALANLYIKLYNRGYDISELPTPERELVEER
jgi:hypothetical protein